MEIKDYAKYWLLRYTKDFSSIYGVSKPTKNGFFVSLLVPKGNTICDITEYVAITCNLELHRDGIFIENKNVERCPIRYVVDILSIFVERELISYKLDIDQYIRK